MEPSTIFFAFLLAVAVVVFTGYIIWIFYQRGAEPEQESIEDDSSLMDESSDPTVDE